MGLNIYNTLTKTKEPFESLEENHVRMYLCGPTVYDLVHVGNMRGAIVFNFFRNFLEYKGYKVTLVYNYTDIDDKIIDAANKNGVSTTEHTEKFIKEFEKDFEQLGLRKATHNPKATETMPEIIELIESIVANGHGYEIEGDVYCSVSSIKDYGKLSHKNLDDLKAGARVEIGEKKKDPMDFALWKAAKPDEPSWDSPWGKGRPGWHIECSAMSKKFLGETFDIHGGGIDLIFPHHENEIAQSEAANGKPFAQRWLHNNFINMGKAKMSKSLGNVFTARSFLEAYNGEILKFMILSAHYRSPSDFSEVVVNHALAGLARVYSSLAQAEKWLKKCEQNGILPNKGKVLDVAGFGKNLKEFLLKVETACDDDFNSPEVIAEIFNLVRSFNGLLRPGIKANQELANSCQEFRENVDVAGGLLALFKEPAAPFLASLDDLLLKEKDLSREVIQQKVEARFEARKKKDFQTSDALRDELIGLGIELRDSVEGTEWEVKK